MSRDPIGERGGKDVYAFSANRVGNVVDFLGLEACCVCFQTRISSSGPISPQFDFANWKLTKWVGLRVATSSDVVGDASKCRYQWEESGEILLRNPDGSYDGGPTEHHGPQPITNPYDDTPGHFTYDEAEGYVWPASNAGQYTITINMTFSARCLGTDGSTTQATTSVVETTTYYVDVLGNVTML